MEDEPIRTPEEAPPATTRASPIKREPGTRRIKQGQSADQGTTPKRPGTQRVQVQTTKPDDPQVSPSAARSSASPPVVQPVFSDADAKPDPSPSFLNPFLKIRYRLHHITNHHFMLFPLHPPLPLIPIPFQDLPPHFPFSTFLVIHPCNQSM